MATTASVYRNLLIFTLLVGSVGVDLLAKKYLHKKGGIVELVVPIEKVPEAFVEEEPVPVEVITIEQSMLEPRELLVEVFTSYVGVLEIGGNNRGPEVGLFLKSVGLGEGHPWCAAFVAYCLNMANIPHTMSAWSPSCCPEAKTYYLASKKADLDNLSVQPGDVFGLYYSNLGRIGHTGFITEWPEGKYCYTVEGNTNSGDGSRDGGGVHELRRYKSKIDKLANWADQ